MRKRKPDDIWITPPEAAAEIRVDPCVVRNWIEKGELIASNVADSSAHRPRWRIRRLDFDLFLESRRPQPRLPVPRRRPAPAKYEYQYFKD